MRRLRVRNQVTSRAEFSVRFTLVGDFAPEEITELTGLLPTSILRAGELFRGSSDRRREKSVWEIKWQGDEAVPVGVQVRSLLDSLEESWEKLAELGERYEAWLLLRAYIYEAQGPEFTLEGDLVKRIARLNASIDVDIYCLGEDAETP